MSKITPATASLMQEILALCLRINNETAHAAFCHYYGHVNSFSVVISQSKKAYNDNILYEECYVNDESVVPLQEIKDKLSRLLPVNKEAVS